MVNWVKSAVLAIMMASDAATFTLNKISPRCRTPQLFATRERVDERVAENTDGQTEEKFNLMGYIMEKLPYVEAALSDSVKSDCPQSDSLCKSMEYSLMAGGKRVRPIIALAACEMFGGSMEDAMPIAVATEMIHTFSLIHDDLPAMDNDDMRRGKPTNHIVYGEDVAILAGDALLSSAFQLVAEKTPDTVSVERKLELIIRMGKACGPMGLAGGQVHDLECEGKNDVTLTDLRWIHHHKTAALLELAAVGGAIAGGATQAEVDALQKFAVDIGLAFQVADDILDVTQTSEELGKTAAKDLDSDKATFPKLMGLEESKLEAKRLSEEAKSALAMFGDRAKPLLAIADFIIERKN